MRRAYESHHASGVAHDEMPGRQGGTSGQFCQFCGAWLGSLGLEPTPDLYIAHMVEVFQECWRVLRKDGCLVLNLGDSYAGVGGNNWGTAPAVPKGARPVYESTGGTDASCKGRGRSGLKPKNKCLTPHRVAIALQADGWILRADVPALKLVSMPESCRDRPTTAHEYIFLLTKSPKYYWDADAIRRRASDWGTRERSAGKYTAGLGAGEPTDCNFALRGRNFRTTDMILDEDGEPLVYVWHPQPFRGSHFACVDTETEALTEDGWKRCDELQDLDRIVAYDAEKGQLEWEPATIHRYQYDGLMVSIEKRDTSQMLTPTHRCIVRRRKSGIGVVQAKDLSPGTDVLLSAPFDPLTTHAGIGEWMAALVGWYITEGHSRAPGKLDIYQSHTANPQHVETIRTLLARLQADVKEYLTIRMWRGRCADSTVFRVTGHVAQMLQHYAPSKEMTADLALLPLSEADALLKALIDGDGHRRKDGRASIIQKSKPSIDLMQMLAIRCGYRAIVTQRTSDGIYTLYLTKGQWLTLRGTDGAHEPIPMVSYSGDVWCPSVPSGFWLARRNGKPFITGNTFPIGLVTPWVRAACPRQCCAECGAPWVRVTEKGAPLRDWQRACGGDAEGGYDGQAVKAYEGTGAENASDVKRRILAGMTDRTHTWQPTCSCTAGTEPGLVLDPFTGSGTVGIVCAREARRFLGVEAKPEYASMANDRIAKEGFGKETVVERGGASVTQLSLFEAGEQT